MCICPPEGRPWLGTRESASGSRRRLQAARADVTTFEQGPTGVQTGVLILRFLFQKVSAPDILQSLSQESPQRPANPVLKQENLSSHPAPGPLFSGGARQVSLRLVSLSHEVWLSSRCRIGLVGKGQREC